jgi:hypothetical protein
LNRGITFLAALATASSLAIVRCGGYSPTYPAPVIATPAGLPGTSSFLVVDGDTGQPVSGARVTFEGVVNLSDGAGRVDLSGSPSAGTLLEISATGYLDRRTSLAVATGSEDPATYSLWPATTLAGLDENVTEELVYTGFAEDAVPGSVPLIRPPGSASIRVVLPPDLRDDVRAQRTVQDSIDAIRAATAGGLDIELADEATPDEVRWLIQIDPDSVPSDLRGTVQRYFKGYAITGADLRFRTVSNLTQDGRLLTHFMGVAFGLGPSPSADDRMYSKWASRRRNDFSDKEAQVMRMMLQRRAGNRFPDDDFAITGTPARAVAVAR